MADTLPAVLVAPIYGLAETYIVSVNRWVNRASVGLYTSVGQTQWIRFVGKKGVVAVSRGGMGGRLEELGLPHLSPTEKMAQRQG